MRTDLRLRRVLATTCLVLAFFIPACTETGSQPDGVEFSEATEDTIGDWKQAAEKGDAEAQNHLGTLYYSGQGVVPQDLKEGVRWYRAAAEQGLAEAQTNLGVAYYDGLGVPKDDKEAGRWYQAAADQGHVKAQNNLGWLYATAKDPEFRDPEKAIEYAKKAVEGSQGKEPGHLDTLAEAYYSNREYDKAIETITKALTLDPGWDYGKRQLRKFEQSK